MNRHVSVTRVYDAPHREGAEYRVLADRLWPRGVKKSMLEFDEWVKDVTPSPELRHWYNHEIEKFSEFARRYQEELTSPTALLTLTRLHKVSETQSLVLLTAVRDVEHSSAMVLRDLIADEDEAS